jgi:hypothetical protein
LSKQLVLVGLNRILDPSSDLDLGRSHFNLGGLFDPERSLLNLGRDHRWGLLSLGQNLLGSNRRHIDRLIE